MSGKSTGCKQQPVKVIPPPSAEGQMKSAKTGTWRQQFNAALSLFSPAFLCRATVKGHRYPAVQSTWILSADAA